MANRVEALIIGTVLCAVGFFGLSLMSSESPIETELGGQSPGARAEKPKGRREGSERAQARSREEPGRRHHLREKLSRETRTDSLVLRYPGGAERTDSPMERGRSGRGPLAVDRSGRASVGRASSVKEGQSKGVSASAAEGRGVTSERRDELIEFLGQQASKRSGGDEGKGDGSGSLSSVDDNPLDEPPVPVIDDESLLLSVPLDGSTEARGAQANDEPAAELDLAFNDQARAVEFSEDSLLAFSDVGVVHPDAGTISLEIEPNWQSVEARDPDAPPPAGYGDNSLVQIGLPGSETPAMWLRRRGQYLHFEWFDDDRGNHRLMVPIRDWEPGVPHRVTATWGEDAMTLYVDGKNMGRESFSGEVTIPPDAMLFLGSRTGAEDPGANAKLRDFRVYDRPLSPEELSLSQWSPTSDQKGHSAAQRP